MAIQYTIQKGDTLAKIAGTKYGDPKLFGLLARFNGLPNPNLITVGQVIELPSKVELLGPAIPPPVTPSTTSPSAPKAGRLAAPNGLDEIITVFGDINKYIKNDGTIDSRWEADILGMARLPFPIPISWAMDKSVSRIQVHKKLVDIYTDLFNEIDSKTMQGMVTSFGGTYNFRTKRTSSKISAHSWGIAIDLNDLTNAQGSAGNMNPKLVELFQSYGFKWGGDWTGKTKDPMHFQYCTGY